MERISAFQKQVYAVCIKIPRGRVGTYGQIARAIKRPRASRAVGSALNKNPFAPAVPCHRVVNSDGRIGGFAFGTKEKIARLKEEKVDVRGGRVVDFRQKIVKSLK